MKLSEKQLELCESSKWDFSDLRALFINCTLKKSPEMSHTDGLIRISQAIMEKNNVSILSGGIPTPVSAIRMTA